MQLTQERLNPQQRTADVLNGIHANIQPVRCVTKSADECPRGGQQRRIGFGIRTLQEPLPIGQRFVAVGTIKKGARDHRFGMTSGRTTEWSDSAF